MGLLFLIIVVILLTSAVPAWPYSRGWGYGPSGALGAVLLILLLLLLLGMIPWGVGPTVVPVEHPIIVP